MEGRMRVSVVATGIDMEAARLAPPTAVPTTPSNVRPLRPVEVPRPSMATRSSGLATAVAMAPAREEPAPAIAATPATPPAVAAQAGLGKIGPEDRLAPPRSEEDLLEIPAFLRRQAN